MELLDNLGFGAALAAVIVAASLIVASLAGVMTRYETRPVQLTDGPHQIVRGPGAVRMSQDRILYSRVGWKTITDNRSGLQVQVYDNGTFVYDISDKKEYKVASEALNASISGPLVVWRQDNKILVRNYINNSQMALPLPTARPLYHPEIYGDKIVWTDGRNDPDPHGPTKLTDIYLYNLTLGNETRLTSAVNPSSKGPPSIWGDLVVWNDGRDGPYSIFGCYLSNGTVARLTNDTSNQYLPQVSTRAIAWLDDRDATDKVRADLFYLDLRTGREFKASKTGQVESFDLWGDELVWTDTSRTKDPGNFGDIVLHNISRNSTKILYSDQWSQYDGAVWSDRLVWVDDLRPGGEIFIMKKVSRPYLGMDLVTVLLLLLLVGVASCSLLAHKHLVQKEEEDMERYEQKALTRKRGQGLK